jgi:hypothetical protein
MLEFELFEALDKDAALFPKYTYNVSDQGREQTLRTIVDHVITQDGDYRQLFTTPRTFLTADLAAIYRVPFGKTSPNHAPTDWQVHTFDKNDPRRGILSHVSFVGLHSHPGRTSPTLRGKAARELLMCQRVPDPPGNVDFNVVQDTSNPAYKTVRQRLDAHATEAMCKGCHKITDSIGLALENFDAIGGYRETENDAGILTAGELDSVKFNDVLGFQEAFGRNAAVTKCFAQKLYSYAMGKRAETAEVKRMESAFAESGYRYKALLRTIAMDPAFTTATPAAEKASPSAH